MKKKKIKEKIFKLKKELNFISEKRARAWKIEKELPFSRWDSVFTGPWDPIYLHTLERIERLQELLEFF